MIAHKCDKCKIYYDSQMNMRLGFYSPFYAEPQLMDLCPTCFTEARTWLGLEGINV